MTISPSSLSLKIKIKDMPCDLTHMVFVENVFICFRPDSAEIYKQFQATFHEQLQLVINKSVLEIEKAIKIVLLDYYGVF